MNMRFSFERLTHHHKEQANQILAQAFSGLPIQVQGQTKCPKYTCSQQIWYQFWNIYMDYCCSNQLSSAVFDLENHRKLVGVFIVRDLMTFNSEFTEFIQRKDNPIQPLMKLMVSLDEKAQQKCPHLFKEKTTADLWGIAIDPKYQGFKLADGLTKEAIKYVGEAKTFKYVSMETLNGKMGKVCINNNFILEAQADGKDYVFDGVKPFEETEVFHRTMRFWSKQLF